MENLTNFIKQHETREIFEPILTSNKDYAITGCSLSGINYDDCVKICKELNEVLTKLLSVSQANELSPHVIKSVCGNCEVPCMFRSIDNNCENEDGCEFKKQTVL